MMLSTVAERGKYHYEYAEYVATSFVGKFCCCFVKSCKCYNQRHKRLKRHEDACEKLTQEVDIVQVLYSHRISQLLARLILKKRQRALVSSFR